MPCNFRTFRRYQPRAPEPIDLSAGFPTAHKYERLLMKGSQGDIEQWTHMRSRTVIVVKVINKPPRMSPEIEVLRDLPAHKSIVKYLGHHEGQPSSGEISILFEYCPQGDLFGFRTMSIEKNRYDYSEPFMWSVYTQLVKAIAFLHKGVDAEHPRGRDNWKPIVHRDIKFENIFVKTLGSKDDWSDIVIKLGDFGMAGFYEPSNPNPRGFIGTTYYWPPEATWQTKLLTPKSDVWGVAAVIHELAHNFGPVVSPELVEENWLKEHKEVIYPENWTEAHKTNYWAAKAPRRVIPINLEPRARMPIMAVLSDPDFGGKDERAIKFRQDRPSPKYSDELNDCMMAALETSPNDRWESAKLLEFIEGKHADYVFQQWCTRVNRENTLARLEGRDKSPERGVEG
ncbi:uncharacterized protein yc1106_04959 [Curvularia clavata]|uniref:non-specific serine/threonine protein kinase n=1 Tax=Curvularia clavata TaxID=95742 RepID=A0A9Q8Z8N0_CURCL|nr:uncharacterized protein yc1106_04959 [Curvularia clavata]